MTHVVLAPEPTTGGLFLSGLVFLSVLRKHRGFVCAQVLALPRSL